MSATIDPGEGYRLLEPGEVIQEGDEYARVDGSLDDWRCTSVPGETCPPATYDVYRRRIDRNDLKPMRHEVDECEPGRWIPVSERPLPDGGGILLQTINGNIELWHSTQYLRHPEQYVAWMPLPAPYEPPKPEKPKRREWCINCNSKAFPVPERGPYGDCTHVREILPGDVDPDNAIGAREFCESVLKYGSGVGYRRACHAVLDILNGEDGE